MKVAITSSSNNNIKNIVLLLSLIQKDVVPEYIFIITKPFKKVVRRKLSELFKTKKHIIQNRYLREYVQEKDISIRTKSLKKICKQNGIKFVYIKSLNNGKFAEIIRTKAIDIVINGGGGLFREDAIRSPKIGIVNAHMGELPKFRGMNVLEWSLFLNARIGVSLHFIDDGIDTGNIISFEKITITKHDTIKSLREKSAPLSIKLLVAYILQPKINEHTFKKQVSEDGKQYFVMHPRLINIVEKKINNCFKR